MAKPKSPIFSLGARGTIADALTYQKRGRETIVREKPIPRDPYSLNQAYQRWDYRDYAYLWTLLSNSEKQIYRTKASRYHITGFSQFMRENLKTLPNLAGRWHLDEKSGAVAHDSSRNANNGVIFGASPATGLIDGAYRSDGVNDHINCGSDPSLTLTDTFTFEFFCNFYALPSSKAWNAHLVRSVSANNWLFIGHRAVDKLAFYVWDTSIAGWRNLFGPLISIETWYHCLGILSAANIYFWINNQYIGSVPCPGFPGSTGLLLFGNQDGSSSSVAYIDHASLYTRALDATERLRHSERRYP